MKQKPPHALWFIVLTFFVAFYLAALPLPGRFMLARPDWVGLMIVFWCLALPERFGILVSFAIGVLFDTLMGTLMGTHGIVFACVAYMILLLHSRMRMYPLAQQSLVVFLVLGISHVLLQWIKGLYGSDMGGQVQIWPALISAFLWPWVYGFLRAMQIRFRVQ